MALVSTLRNIPLFRSLPDEDLTIVANYLQKERHPKGSIIFREGDQGDTMYLVESGQIAVVGQLVRDTIDYMGPGSVVGEIALLLDQPRTASMQVTLDAELWALRRQDFEQLVAFRPTIAREMMRQLSRRLISVTQEKPTSRAQRIVAVFGARARAAMCQAMAQLTQETIGVLTLPGVHLAGDTSVQAGLMMLGTDSLTEESLARSLSYQVEVFRYVVICLPDDPTSLAQKALELVDVVVSIGAPPAWAADYAQDKEFLNVSDADEEIARTARYLTNRRVGLALSSGGARNLAHIGVIKVLMEENIPIDMVAGTSGGAWFGSFYCSGWTIAEFDRFVATIQKQVFRFANADFNLLPRTALFKGKRARDHVIADTVKVKDFADLHTPLFVVAADV
ncbi:MAG: cyclic nucleotide-binding domain-containing protein, partial [Chloroflexota bacterium]